MRTYPVVEVSYLQEQLRLALEAQEVRHSTAWSTESNLFYLLIKFLFAFTFLQYPLLDLTSSYNTQSWIVYNILLGIGSINSKITVMSDTPFLTLF